MAGDKMTVKRNRNIQRAYREALRFRRKGLTPAHMDRKAGAMMEKARRTNKLQKAKKYRKRWGLLSFGETIWSASIKE